jgi:PAS domain-containing protein
MTQAENVPSVLDDPELRALFAAMPCACMIHRMIFGERGEAVDYIPLEANPWFSNLLDVDPFLIIGKRATEYLPEAEARYWAAVFAPVALEGRTVSVSVFSPRKKATYRVTAISPERGYFIVMFSVAGEESAIWTHAQIARWTDGRLSEHEAVRQMFHTMPCAAAIHRIDRDGQGKPIDYSVVDVNEEFCGFIDTTPGEIIGMRASDRLPGDELAHWLAVFSPVAFGERRSSEVRLFLRHRSVTDGILIALESGIVMVLFTTKDVSKPTRM